MAETFAITAEWEVSETRSAAPEDRVTLAAIGISYNDIWLTEANDMFVGRVRQTVHLSSYRLAEWFAWNWWRLRWEPRGNSLSWRTAHRMTSVGGGYVWPNITFISDGERVVVDAKPTQSRPSEPLRYLADLAVVVPVLNFEKAVDAFVEKVRAKLVDVGITNTNLEQIWSELLLERVDPALSWRRTLEALLGFDPDEADPDVVERLVNEADELGESAIQELAANAAGAPPPTAAEIRAWARSGSEWRPIDTVRLHDRSEHALPVKVAAWKRGSAAARALRQQEALGSAPLSDQKLCDLLGVVRTAISHADRRLPISFALAGPGTDAHIALKSPHNLSRRFHLARLLGDKVAGPLAGKLAPATDAVTYRQKLQRSFAAEFLCPFEALADMLRGDFSEEAITDAAEDFNVSSWAVRTILANHGLIDREDLMATA